MSYCSIEEAFQSSITDSILPPNKQQLLEPSDGGDKGRLKSRRSRRSPLPPQEPSVIEPDRPAHRPKPPAELLGGGSERNDSTTSLSSFLIGVGDPAEDYFPYPNGSGEEPGYDKMFMLQPNWYEQFQDRVPSPTTETPPLPGASVDGYSTLYQRVPSPKSKTDEVRNQVLKAELPGNPVSIAAASVLPSSIQDVDLRKRIDELFNKMDQLEVNRAETNHTEIILFVMTGIFVLLMLDLLLKQGSRAIGNIATAAAVPIRGGASFNSPFFF